MPNAWPARTFPGNAVSYYFPYHLKTASVINDATGNIKSESDYYHILSAFTQTGLTAPDGKGPAFGSINSASEALGSIISDSRVAQVNLVPAGTTLTEGITLKSEQFQDTELPKSGN